MGGTAAIQHGINQEHWTDLYIGYRTLEYRKLNLFEYKT